MAAGIITGGVVISPTMSPGGVATTTGGVFITTGGVGVTATAAVVIIMVGVI